MEKISVWRLMAETVNSPISIADVQKFNGIDEAKVANGHYPTFGVTVQFSYLRQPVTHPGVRYSASKLAIQNLN